MSLDIRVLLEELLTSGHNGKPLSARDTVTVATALSKMPPEEDRSKGMELKFPPGATSAAIYFFSDDQLPESIQADDCAILHRGAVDTDGNPVEPSIVAYPHIQLTPEQDAKIAAEIEAKVARLNREEAAAAPAAPGLALALSPTRSASDE